MNAHPVDRAADVLGGEERVVLAWLGMVAVALVVTPRGSNLGALGTLAVFIGGALLFANRSHERGRQEDDLADAQAKYVDGEIDEQEFERQLDLILDDRARRIRREVEQVGGVGSATSANIALRFRTLDDVRAADPDTLEQVNGVGPQRAEAIADRLGGADS